MKAIKPLYFLILSLFVVGCTKEAPIANTEEDHKLALEEMVNAFYDNTGITIWYEPSTDQNQKEIELSHGIEDEDYFDERKKYQKLRYRLPELVTELNSYPNAFIDEVDVRFILIVKSSMLNYAGQAKGFTHSLVLNWAYYSSWKEVLSHELFHLFDPAPGNSSWSEEQQQFDLEWQLLNPPNFTYGDGCGYNNSTSTYTKGFLTEYSRCSSIEDRAVTFENIIHKNEIVEEFIKTDTFLKSKVNFMKTLVNDFGYDL